MQNIDYTTTAQRLHGTQAERLPRSFKIGLYIAIALFMAAGFCFAYDIANAQVIQSVILH
jgi:hypothetical protein